MGREEQGRTWCMDSSTRMLRMKKEAILKPARPIYSTNRSSSQLDRPSNSIELESMVKPEKCYTTTIHGVLIIGDFPHGMMGNRLKRSTKSSNMLALEMEFIGVGWVSLSNDPTASKA
ncbi:unnamed protein product [Microthlaspi erraticum]|uniref:Uncharacterized protein n=1 Tax=Microthlaspi erraticum TaxID=1685480 RepID=A0A6D2JXN1_9BRAS|nr:unnamed protein product [Microthlaspi erraticum]